MENFRNFASLEIDPFPTPAVIVGENQIGKSNLLYALRLVLDPDLPDRRRLLLPDDIHEHGRTTLAQGAQVRIEVELAGFDDDVDACAELTDALVGIEPGVARLTYLFRPRKSLGLAAGSAPPEPLTPDDYEWTIFGGEDESNAMPQAKRYAGLSVLPALRDAESDLTRSDRNPLTRMLRELPPSTDNIDRALKAMDEARVDLGRDPNVRRLAALIRTRVRELGGPQMRMDPTLGFVGRDEDLMRGIRLFIDDAATHGLDRASTGTANVLYLALLLERLQLRRGAPDSADMMLAVEEPEAHLHPTLQRHLFARLLDGPSRLVMTTHSPHIAAVTPLPSLVLLLEDQGATVARLLKDGELTDTQLADMQRYLNVHRAELLFARHVVLVEGAAELYLLPALARAAGFDLDAHGVVVASVEGTDFLPYARLLGPRGWNRPCLFLTDGDAVDGEDGSGNEPGLGRASAILGIGQHPQGTAPDFATRLDTVCLADLPTDGTQREGRQALVERAAECGVFVGPHTLETDLVPLLASEMKAAFTHLVTGPVRRRNFADNVDTVAATPTADVRGKLVARIESNGVGKGRYAQRLAAEVEKADLPALVREQLGAPPDRPLPNGELLAMSGCGPILALLDDLSREVRDLPLVPTPDERAATAPTGEDAGRPTA